MREERICGRCRKPAVGMAMINGQWYCHPDNPFQPDCYSLTSWDLSRWTGSLPQRFVMGGEA